MNIITLDSQPDPQLAAALYQFEKGFSYPLGETQRFHVLHD